jgi:hypothetical protein
MPENRPAPQKTLKARGTAEVLPLSSYFNG